jgi:anion-transporting  ArsA/GET3 family ATPase
VDRGVLGRRLVVVTGKGGVGKSTVAAALGLAAARRGRRVIIVELAGRNDVRRALTGVAAGGGYVERRLMPRLDHISIDPAAR